MNQLKNDGLHSNITSFQALLEDLKGRQIKSSVYLKDRYLSGDINDEIFIAAKDYYSNLNTDGFRDEVAFLISSYEKADKAGKQSLFMDRIEDLMRLGELNKIAGGIILLLLRGSSSIKTPKSTKSTTTSLLSEVRDPCGTSRHTSIRC